MRAFAIGATALIDGVATLFNSVPWHHGHGCLLKFVFSRSSVTTMIRWRRASCKHLQCDPFSPFYLHLT
ncbi:hypothetical protein L484_022881 [Morus notabilis]|uniref:Uncharacterized protein n=1 Tax=Morus notabilis TaxID=981085 RepID=W9RK32_9ROSA|nr:hypothetical protein L484_022881 [Morus notabilis]